MRPASSIGHPACSVPGAMAWPGAVTVCLVGRIGRSFPASGARQGLWAQDTRTVPLDV
jgi:hypothetical protein